MLYDYNLGLINYTSEEVEVIEECLLKEGYSKDEVIQSLKYGTFVLYNGCHTLEDIVKYTESQYGVCLATAQELDIHNVWFETPLGIIISEL